METSRFEIVEESQVEEEKTITNYQRKKKYVLVILSKYSKKTICCFSIRFGSLFTSVSLFSVNLLHLFIFPNLGSERVCVRFSAISVADTFFTL